MIQKLPLNSESTFIARTYETPDWETPYHQHGEYELMVIRNSKGTAFIGDHIGSFEEGDTYLLGKDLPHWFRKQDESETGSSMVVQFQEHAFGKDFLSLPQARGIAKLLHASSRGLSLHGRLREEVGRDLIELEHMDGMKQLLALLDLLDRISRSSEHVFLSHQQAYNYSDRDKQLINRVFDYSLKHFKRKITLEEVAGLCNKSVSSFSHYFKKTTKVGYVRFLTQIRISHACSLLKETELSVAEICYQSGFNSWANFSKQFRSLAGMPPRDYRRLHRK